MAASFCESEASIHFSQVDAHTSPLGYTSDLVDNKVAIRKAHVDLDRKPANSGIDIQIYTDSAPTQMEGNDENHGQCAGLAELSFRIDALDDLGSKLRNLDASMSSTMFGKGIENEVEIEANNSSAGGEDMLILQCRNKMPSEENIHVGILTPFAHVDECTDRILNNGGVVSSDLVVYNPNHNNARRREEVREMNCADAADCTDGKMMKIGGILLRKSSFPMQSNKPKISSLLNRNYQSQVFSSRSKYECTKAECTDKHGVELERSITYPRASEAEKVFPVQTQEEREEIIDYEDLYQPARMLPDQIQNYRAPFYLSDHQEVSCLEEEELYPVLAQRQGFVGSSFTSQNDPYSHGAELHKRVKEHLPYQVSSSHLSSVNSKNPHSFNGGAEGYLVNHSDSSSACFTGTHVHPHARFQNFRHHSNEEQYSVDFYGSRLSSGNGATTSHQFTVAPFTSRKDISPSVPQHPLKYAPYANTCYSQHACMQPPSSHMPSSGNLHFCASTCTQQHTPPLPYHQPWHHAEDQCPQHTSYGRSSMNLPQRALHKQQQTHGGAGPVLQSESYARTARRKENCPPIPGPGALPYVLCQGCHKILKIPDNLHYRSALQRIRCSACGRISKFCNVLHTHSQAVFENGFNYRALSLPTRMGRFDQVAAHDVKKVPMPLDRNLRSSCGCNGQCDRADKYAFSQAHAARVSSYDIVKLDRFCNSGLTTMMPKEQRPCEFEWRYGTTDYGVSSGFGKVRENYSPFFVNGSGVLRNAAGHPSHKMQQFKARAELGQGKEAFSAPRFADDCIQEQNDNRVRVSSGEMKGLSLGGCPQEGSCGGSSLQIRHADSRSLQQGHGNGVVNNGLNGALSSPVAGSPLHEHLSYDAASEFGEWSHKHEEKGKQADDESSVQEVSKGSKFLSGLLKKNIREFGRGQGSSKNWKVVVNGQMLPYAAVKSAEKQAGTIRPGIYWYDYRAGFWGVMGGPCLGIIPPSIAEFNFPLAKECAGGTTGVFVNGRELHKKDLDVLSGRGLPKIRGKAYMVDISGQVIDQTSGQLLRSLGRLAPTIERRNRGCGMFQPPAQQS